MKGFTNRGEKCINLHKFMRDKRSSPDFGFDNAEIAVTEDVRDPWVYMCSLMQPKFRQKALWTCISKMNKIKRQFNEVVN